MDLGLRVNGFVDWVKSIGLPWWATANAAQASLPEYVLHRLGRQDTENMWRGDDILARVIERPAEDMVREGWTISTGDTVLDAQVATRMAQLHVRERFQEAIKFQRGYGGGAVLLGANDGRNLAEPIAPGLVHQVDWLQAIESWDLNAAAWDNDLASPLFGHPLTYHYSGPFGIESGPSAEVVSTEIHRSRLLLFNGIVTSRLHRRERSGWGDPVTMRMLDAVKSYKLAWSVVGELLKGSSQPTLKLSELYPMMETEKGQALATRRVQLFKEALSSMNVAVLDKNDAFERVAVNFTGVPELLDRQAIRVSASADIPATLLMGQSPGGMDATGDSDIRGYYDRIHARQELELAPHLKRLAAMLIGGLRPDHQGVVSVTFAPLWQMSELEQAQSERVRAETDQVRAGVRPAAQPPRNGIAHSDAVT